MIAAYLKGAAQKTAHCNVVRRALLTAGHTPSPTALCAVLGNLPFTPEKVFPVSYNAWANDWDAIEESKKYIQDECSEGYTFLFCCGPFGNILCHELTEFNSNNTYLDVGSTLNPFLRSEGFQRDYYMGNNFFSNAVGVWDNATG